MTTCECIKSHLCESTFQLYCLLSHVHVSVMKRPELVELLMRCVSLRGLPRCREDEEPPAFQTCVLMLLEVFISCEGLQRR